MCTGLESTYQEALYFYGIMFLFLRPAMVIYCFYKKEMFRDILPPFAGVVQYIVICLRCGYNLLCANSTWTINTDSMELITEKENSKRRDKYTYII